MFDLLTRKIKKKNQKEFAKNFDNKMTKSDTFEQSFADIKLSFEKTLDTCKEDLYLKNGVLTDKNATAKCNGAFCFVRRGNKKYCASNSRATASISQNSLGMVNSDFLYKSYYFPRFSLVPSASPFYSLLNFSVACKNREVYRRSLQLDSKTFQLFVPERPDKFQTMMMKIRSGGDVGPIVEHALSDETMETENSNTSDLIIQNSQILSTFSVNNKYLCKHAYFGEGGNKVYMPRSFQHHVLTAHLKNVYENTQGYTLRKNYQCPPSRCCEVKPKNKEESLEMVKPVIDDINLVTWRYSRTKKICESEQLKKHHKVTEYMCRYCKEKTWISNIHYFEHLFTSHGILTSMKPSFQKSTSDEFRLVKDVHYGNGRTCTNNRDITGVTCSHVEEEKSIKTFERGKDAGSYFDIASDDNTSIKIFTKCKIANPYHFLNRNILPHLSVQLLPLPLKMFQEVITKKTHFNKRVFSQCPYCFCWVSSCVLETLTNFSVFHPYFTHLINECKLFSKEEYCHLDTLFLEG